MQDFQTDLSPRQPSGMPCSPDWTWPTGTMLQQIAVTVSAKFKSWQGWPIRTITNQESHMTQRFSNAEHTKNPWIFQKDLEWSPPTLGHLAPSVVITCFFHEASPSISWRPVNPHRGGTLPGIHSRWCTWQDMVKSCKIQSRMSRMWVKSKFSNTIQTIQTSCFTSKILVPFASWLPKKSVYSCYFEKLTFATWYHWVTLPVGSGLRPVHMLCVKKWRTGWLIVPRRPRS